MKVNVDLSNSSHAELGDLLQAVSSSMSTGNISAKGQKDYYLILNMREITKLHVWINSITISYTVYGTDTSALNQAGTLKIGAVLESGDVVYNDGITIGKGASNATSTPVTITGNTNHSNDQAICVISFVNNRSLGTNSFVLSSLSIEIDCYPLKYVIEVEGVNAGSDDTIYLMDKSLSSNLGLKGEFYFQAEDYYVCARAGNGKQIEKIKHINFHPNIGYFETVWDAEQLIESGWLDPNCQSLQLPGGRGDDGSEITDYREAITVIEVYFKPPVTIYVGQTQALRAYVGTQEILNIL